MALMKNVNGKQVPMTPEEEAAIIAEWEATSTELTSTQYQIQRQAEYPPIGDQLDTIIKQFAALSSTVALSQEMQALVTTIQAIKDKYPKPVEGAVL